MNTLERRIIDISYKKGLSHIGSCLTAVNIIDEIYREKHPQDVFILSSGHAGLALYVVLEHYGLGNAEDLFDKHGVHPNTDLNIFCSSGSLGHGIGIAVGTALTGRSRTVYCLISDGECAEGSVWEALRIAHDQNLTNLVVYVNINGYSATQTVGTKYLKDRLRLFFPVRFRETAVDIDCLKGLEGHYHKLTKEEYEGIA